MFVMQTLTLDVWFLFAGSAGFGSPAAGFVVCGVCVVCTQSLRGLHAGFA